MTVGNKISEKVAQWACDVVDYCTAKTERDALLYISDTEFGELCNKIYAILPKDCSEISLTKIAQKTQGILPRMRNDALTNLGLGGKIKSTERKSSKRAPTKTRFYRRIKSNESVN